MGNEEKQSGSPIEQKKALRPAGLRAASASVSTATPAAPSKSAPSGSEQSSQAPAVLAEEAPQEVPAEHKEAPAETAKAQLISNLFDDFDLAPEKKPAFNAGQAGEATATEPTQEKKPSESSRAKKDQPVIASSKEVEKPKVNLGLIVGIIAAVVVLMAGILFYNWYSSPTQAAIRSVEQNDFVQAVFHISQDLTGKGNPKLQGLVVSKAAEVKDGYLAGTITFQDATSSMEALKKLGHTQTISYIEEMYSSIAERETSRNSYLKAEQMYSAGELPEAIKNYRLVAEDDPNYMDAQAKLHEVISAYHANVLQVYTGYASLELYVEGLEVLNDALKVLPNDAELTVKKAECEKQIIQKTQDEALGRTTELSTNGNYLDAISEINNTISAIGQTPELAAALNEYKSNYADQVYSQADAMISERNFSGAIDLLSIGLRNLPDDPRLSSLLEYARSHQPVSLSDFRAVNGNWNWDQGFPEDAFGNRYSYAKNFFIWEAGREYSYNGTDFVEYRLYGKYESISGTIAPYTSMTQNETGYIQIYADEKLVYTSPTIGRKSDAVKFEADISGADYVILRLNGKKYDGFYGTLTSIILCDLEVHPAEGAVDDGSNWNPNIHVENNSVSIKAVVTYSLNIRSGPGTNHSVVSTLSPGDSVTILEIETVNGHQWGKIEAGWIDLSYVNVQ